MRWTLFIALNSKSGDAGAVRDWANRALRADLGSGWTVGQWSDCHIDGGWECGSGYQIRQVGCDGTCPPPRPRDRRKCKVECALDAARVHPRRLLPVVFLPYWVKFLGLALAMFMIILIFCCFGKFSRAKRGMGDHSEPDEEQFSQAQFSSRNQVIQRPPETSARDADFIAAQEKGFPGHPAPDSCPCGHSLRRFQVATDTWVCSECHKAAAIGSALHGCRQCQFDLCDDCAGCSPSRDLQLAEPLFGNRAPAFVPRFSLGDRVKSFQTGQRGTVVALDADGDPTVRLDCGGVNAYFADDFSILNVGDDMVSEPRQVLVQVPEVLEKVVEVPRVVKVEKIIEVPEVQEVVRSVPITEVHEIVREVPKIVEVEQVVHVPKIQFTECVVEARRACLMEASFFGFRFSVFIFGNTVSSLCGQIVGEKPGLFAQRICDQPQWNILLLR
mmetsp:Transcript_59448/g.137373  ORF Transcript_59448/g.137373 Transcript_59448/m.137373 type:complete len:444 (+) Transcript_59448:45-1376(+)